MLTDTQWLLSALVAELTAAGIADRVETYNGISVEDAMEQLHSYPTTAILIMPDVLTMEHDFQGGVAVKALITRKVNIFLAAAKPGKVGGGMTQANGMMDAALARLSWNELGTGGRVVVKPVSAQPQEVYFENQPGRALWMMQADVTCIENDF